MLDAVMVFYGDVMLNRHEPLLQGNMLEHISKEY